MSQDWDPDETVEHHRTVLPKKIHRSKLSTGQLQTLTFVANASQHSVEEARRNIVPTQSQTQQSPSTPTPQHPTLAHILSRLTAMESKLDSRIHLCSTKSMHSVTLSMIVSIWSKYYKIGWTRAGLLTDFADTLGNHLPIKTYCEFLWVSEQTVNFSRIWIAVDDHGQVDEPRWTDCCPADAAYLNQQSCDADILRRQDEAQVQWANSGDHVSSALGALFSTRSGGTCWEAKDVKEPDWRMAQACGGPHDEKILQ